MNRLLAAVLCLSVLAPLAARAGDAELRQRGEYLARIGDCAACHTSRGGALYAGGRAIETPFGVIVSPNITPDPETGIGRWSPDDFRRAVRHGIAPGGKLLYPAFPFISFTLMSDDDVDAIHAYLAGVPAVRAPNQPPRLRFPYSVRPLLMAWRALYFTPRHFAPDKSKSAAWNRGAYLVRGVAHCNECHTPRNGLGAMQTDRALTGAPIPAQHFYAPALVTGKGGGLEGWSEDDLVEFLTTGRSLRGSAFGPMAEVIVESLQYLRPDDARAIAIYLLDQKMNDAAPHARGIDVPSQQAHKLAIEGEAIYADRCAACHGERGEGAGRIYPPLAGNRIVAGAEVNLIRVVLLGGFQPATRGNPRPYSMPAFAPELGDRDVAAVVTYIRQRFGDGAAAVAPATVARYRSVPRR